jgi:hypothetical protein
LLSEFFFPVVLEEELIFETKLSVTTVRTEKNPFPKDTRGFLDDPLDDPRLASAGPLLYDPETQILAAIVFTNKSIFAVYARLPGCRLRAKDAASFVHMAKIGTRDFYDPLCDFDAVAIGFDAKRNILRWYVDGNEVFRVNQIGRRLPDNKIFLILDHGGRDVTVCPHQFAIGYGTFTFLDAHKPNNMIGCDNHALVRLTQQNDFYFYPFHANICTGCPVPDQSFFDPCGLECNRIWGQGASMRLLYAKVFYLATC